MLTSEGDGIKTYAVMCGHIRNDSSLTEYQNMNYPYGQTHVFTDGQTLITTFVKGLAVMSPWFEKHSVGIFNCLWLVSFPMCAYFLALIFLRLHLPHWYVIIASTAITLLCPQVFRFEGHLTLTYACIIPAYWYLILRYRETEKPFRFSVVLIILNSLLFFIHPYFTIILVAFTFCFGLFDSLPWFRMAPLNEKKILGYLIQIVLPLIISQSVVASMDQHSGRPLYPAGFFEHFATFSTVFLPIKDPFHSLITTPLGIAQDHWEGWAYIGIASGLIAIFMIVRAIRCVFRKKFIHILHPVHSHWLTISLFAGIVLLIYSMAVPFRLGGEPLLQVLPLIRQFRSLGRFAWIFYFVFGVCSFYVAWLMTRSLLIKGKKTFAFLFLFAFLSLQMMESLFQFKAIAGDLTKSPNYFNPASVRADYAALVKEVRKIQSEYQCVIPVPFYHIGSDQYTTPDVKESMRGSMVLSYSCNIPLLSSSAARTPVHEAKNIVQFFSPPFIQKEIQKDLLSKKPFLLLKTWEPTDTQEDYWLGRSTLIWENITFKLYRLDYNSVFTPSSDSVYHNIMTELTGFSHPDSGSFTKTGNYFYYNNFDSLEQSHARYGKGCFAGNKNEENRMLNEQKLLLVSGQMYELSFWYNNSEESSNQIDVDFLIRKPGTTSDTLITSISPSRSKIIDGDWSLVSFQFKAFYPDAKYSLRFRKDAHSHQRFYADELLIRPVESDVYAIEKQSSGLINSVFKNNYRFANTQAYNK